VPGVSKENKKKNIRLLERKISHTLKENLGIGVEVVEVIFCRE